jgi:FAD-linked sulfhydryl oxidase
MEPAIWGPKLWFMMHTMSFNYPVSPTYNDKVNMKTFFEILKFVIPCDACRDHYTTHLSNMPVDNYLNTKENLIMWVLKLHNSVNEMLNKPTWTLEQTIEHYSKIFNTKCNSGKCSSGPNKTFMEKYYKYISISILLSILGLIVFFMLYKRKCLLK